MNKHVSRCEAPQSTSARDLVGPKVPRGISPPPPSPGPLTVSAVSAPAVTEMLMELCQSGLLRSSVAVPLLREAILVFRDFRGEPFLRDEVSSLAAETSRLLMQSPPQSAAAAGGGVGARAPRSISITERLKHELVVSSRRESAGDFAELDAAVLSQGSQGEGAAAGEGYTGGSLEEATLSSVEGLVDGVWWVLGTMLEDLEEGVRVVRESCEGERREDGSDAPERPSGMEPAASGEDADMEGNGGGGGLAQEPAVVRATVAAKSFVRFAGHCMTPALALAPLALPMVTYLQGVRDPQVHKLSVETQRAALSLCQVPHHDAAVLTAVVRSMFASSLSPLKGVVQFALGRLCSLAMRHVDAARAVEVNGRSLLQQAPPGGQGAPHALVGAEALAAVTGREGPGAGMGVALRVSLLGSLRAMSDPRPEVQVTGAFTLTGLVRLLPAGLHQWLRGEFLGRASELRRRVKGKRGREGEGAEERQELLAAMKGAVRGLGAFVEAYPFEVPEWMPGVVSELVRCGLAERRVRPLVTGTLAQLHKTHEEESGMAELRRYFSEDDWDNFRSLAAPASYFC